MRIYLACTVRGSRAGVEAARRIATRLQALGHDVLTSHLLRDDVEQVEASATDRDVYARDLRWLESCDALVAEASGSTYGVGFEVGYLTGRAPLTGQRVCVFYEAAARDRVSRLVTGYHSPHGDAVAYGSLDELDALVCRRFGPAPAGTLRAR